MRVVACCIVFLCPVLSHAQPDVPLDQFIEEYIIQQDERFKQREEVAPYLRALDPGRLRIVRNAFFAKHGYTFDDSNLQRYFERQSWYEAEDRELSLSSTEERNIEFVESLEERAEAQFEAFSDRFDPCTFPVHAPKEEKPDFRNSGAEIDSLAGVLLLNGPGEYMIGTSRGAKIRPGCRLKKTDRYRAFLFMSENHLGNKRYFVITFDEFGRRISRQKLISYGGTQETDSGITGAVEILNRRDVLIKAKRTKYDYYSRQDILTSEYKKKEVTTWTWYTFQDDGSVVETHPPEVN